MHAVEARFQGQHLIWRVTVDPMEFRGAGPAGRLRPEHQLPASQLGQLLRLIQLVLTQPQRLLGSLAFGDVEHHEAAFIAGGRPDSEETDE